MRAIVITAPGVDNNLRVTEAPNRRLDPEKCSSTLRIADVISPTR